MLETIAAEKSETGRTHDAVRAVLTPGAAVGRYVVLAKVGAGAVGIVYAAYDPELDRKIALKLLEPSAAASATHPGESRRLLREAQALAKLSHPNVVAVHDVGEHDGRVFLAMELVAGRTLRAWIDEERPAWSRVLDVYVRAGRGLQAAHEQSLVHRDFKPDNVMLGDDARVRVMDFGLARADAPVRAAAGEPQAKPRERALDLGLTEGDALVGTPAYMAPELFDPGRDAELVAADQFAFCVSVWEGLYGRRPFRGDSLVDLVSKVLTGEIEEPPANAGVPRWLRRALQRGLATDPRARWPSMAALLDALERGRVRARVRLASIVAGAIATLGIGAAAWQRSDVEQRRVACERAGEGIREVWNAETRADLRASLIATGVDFAAVTADKVLPWLDEYADAWQSARAEACVDAQVHGTWDAGTLERAVWCLDERRMELSALIDAMSRGGGRALERAVEGAAGLRQVAPCRHAELLSRLPSPPTEQREEVSAVREELSRAHALQVTGAFADGLLAAKNALARAEALAWPPLVAAARRSVGRLLENTGEFAEAERVLQAAYFEAMASGAVDVALDSADTLAFVVGYRLARDDDGRLWARHAELALAELPDPARMREGAHAQAIATVHLAAGAHADARDLFGQALGIFEQALGPWHPGVATSLNHLANAQRAAGALAEAEDLHRRALAIREHALGPDHPHVATSLNNLANIHTVRREHAQAKALQERAIAIMERSMSAEHPHVAKMLANLANTHRELGAYAEAKALHERALAILEKAMGPDHVELAGALNNLALCHKAMGEVAEATAMHRRVVAIREKSLGPDHPDLATSLNNLASVLCDAGEHVEARPLYERALAIWEKALAPGHPNSAYALIGLSEVALRQHRLADAVGFAERAMKLRETAGAPSADLAEARFQLARAQLDAGLPRAAAVELAEQARDEYRSADADHARDVAELEQWLATHER